jgi:Zn-dependent protease with chaperone function
MLQLTYLFVLTTALVATHLAVYNRDGRAAELPYNAYALLAFLLAAVASFNVELPNGTTDSALYLALLWGLLALFNVLFVVEALVRELDADADYLALSK